MFKKYLILLAGPPATGKSFLSQLICQEIPQTYTISPDEIKQDLAVSVGFSNLEEKELLEARMWRLYYEALDLYMRIGKQFILTEYPFSDKQKINLHSLSKEHNYQIITIRLTADFEVLWKRRITRDLAADRHLSFISSHYHFGDKLEERIEADDLITKQGFRNIIKERGYNHFGLGELFEFDVTDFSKVDYTKILNYLKSLDTSFG